MKMETKKICAVSGLLLSLAIAQPTYARGTATGLVESVTSSDNVINVYLSVDSSPVSGETIPACVTRQDFFVLSSDQKNQLAILLTAKALDTMVKVNGKGSCDVNGKAEDISSVRIN